ncbi:heme NO-binding domain-containing protein [Pseudooceanicola sp. LIPI14-2-Ac024]|uniref:heme NO-binding domain-containing protein n=1 Tax=Pseudooceanicola sp. LIPI14-2-Ac024 TaxID=3344875 RepID=UPI0035D07817
MHGLINLALQRFATDTYGRDLWDGIAHAAGLGFSDFEPMMLYEPEVTEAVVDALARRLGRDRAALLEDVGTYLVSHPNSAPVRRLLRFCGAGFEDFLQSLDELPDRARLAVPELDLPRLELRVHGPTRCALVCDGAIPGAGHVLVGVLRAMADDYGALVTLEHMGTRQGRERIGIALVMAGYSEGRRFDLGARTG